MYIFYLYTTRHKWVCPKFWHNHFKQFMRRFSQIAAHTWLEENQCCYDNCSELHKSNLLENIKHMLQTKYEGKMCLSLSLYIISKPSGQVCSSTFTNRIKVPVPGKGQLHVARAVLLTHCNWGQTWMGLAAETELWLWMARAGSVARDPARELSGGIDGCG